MSEMSWRTDLENAPQDGTRILAWWKHTDSPVLVRWNGAAGYKSFTTGSRDPFGIPDQYAPSWFTHWMPVEAPQ